MAPGKNPVNNPSNLTAPANLHAESGEAYPNFNDVDDYNGYTKTDATMPSAVFNVSCSVVYVNPATPDVTSYSQTWTKKITVTVTSSLMADTVKLSSLFSYWVFE